MENTFMNLRSVALITVVFALFVSLTACGNQTEKLEKSGIADWVITRVENFKKDKGRLPADMHELDYYVTEGGPVFYDRDSGSKYNVSYEVGWEQYTFESDTQEWKESSVSYL